MRSKGRAPVVTAVFLPVRGPRSLSLSDYASASAPIRLLAALSVSALRCNP